MDSARKGAHLFLHSLAQRTYAFPSFLCSPSALCLLTTLTPATCLACFAIVYALSHAPHKMYSQDNCAPGGTFAKRDAGGNQSLRDASTCSFMLTGGVVGDQDVEFFEEGDVALSGILFQRFAIVREIVKERLDALLV